MQIPEQYKPWKGFVFKMQIPVRERQIRYIEKEYIVDIASEHCVLCHDSSSGVPTSFRYDELIKAGVIDRKAGYPHYCIDF